MKERRGYGSRQVVGSLVVVGALIVVWGFASAGAPFQTVASACEPTTTYGSELAPSPDLYCLLLTPHPDFPEASGRVELRIPSSPFGLSVGVDGRQLYDGVLTLDGLPPIASLAPHSHYVVWLTTPLLHPQTNLGTVENGVVELGRIDLDKFMVLISAESEPDGVEREGRIVLRGSSPSSRMRPPDMMEFLIGAGSRDAAAMPMPGMRMNVPADSGDMEMPTAGRPADGWPRPPMPEGIAMLPALMQLDPPDVSPFSPGVPDPEAIPFAQPRELVEMGDGDVLQLEAGYVRRTLRGRTHVMYGFNGQIPGPLIWVPEAATIQVDFTNSIDWPTTVHWHGIRIDNASDGVPGVTQDPVEPGETFRYTIHFKDPGIYWYHPHHREDLLQELGLYGNMVVQPSRPDYFGPANREEVVILDDFLIGDQGAIPMGGERATHALMGRFGNLFLINGEPSYDLAVDQGEVVRFFLTNVSNTRTFNLSFDGAPIKVVGSDIGNFERESWAESVVIAPAERYVVHVRFPEPGSYRMVNRVRGIDHLNGQFFQEIDTLGEVSVSDTPVAANMEGAFADLRDHRFVSEEIDPYRDEFDRPVDRELIFTLETDGLPFVVERLMRFDSAYFHPVEWSGTMPMMNWNSTPEEVRWLLRDPRTGREDLEIDWRFKVGDVVKIRLSNERRAFHAMQHPFHMHGQRFLILSRNGIPNDNLVWKDTVLLPVGGTVDLLLEVTNPGRWMAHCHIAEHLEAGMRTVFTVDP